MVCIGGLMLTQKIDAQLNDSAETVPNVQLNYDQLAARFLDQATAGATPLDVASLSAALATHPNTAFSDWLNGQYAKPVDPKDLSLTTLRADDTTGGSRQELS